MYNNVLYLIIFQSTIVGLCDVEAVKRKITAQVNAKHLGLSEKLEREQDKEDGDEEDEDDEEEDDEEEYDDEDEYDDEEDQEVIDPEDGHTEL